MVSQTFIPTRIYVQGISECNFNGTVSHLVRERMEAIIKNKENELL